jgi:transcriptional regulatory protein LevR
MVFLSDSFVDCKYSPAQLNSSLRFLACSMEIDVYIHPSIHPSILDQHARMCVLVCTCITGHGSLGEIRSEP